MLLTEKLVEMIRNAVEIIATTVGWGTVTIVVEDGRVTKLQREVSVKVDRALVEMGDG